MSAIHQSAIVVRVRYRRMMRDVAKGMQKTDKVDVTVEIPLRSSSSTEAVAAVVVLVGCFATFVADSDLPPLLLLEAAPFGFLDDMAIRWFKRVSVIVRI